MGLDFLPAAIAEARRLAVEIGVAAPLSRANASAVADAATSAGDQRRLSFQQAGQRFPPLPSRVTRPAKICPEPFFAVKQPDYPRLCVIVVYPTVWIRVDARETDRGITLGAPPKTGWAKLVPELLVSDISASLEFWCGRLGFVIAYQRPKEAFAYLERPEGAQIMLSQRSGKWETGPLDRPYGRGAMFQVYVASIEPVERSLEAAGWQLYAGPCEVWRKVGKRQAGQREIFVLDPDGYLVMVADDLGERPLPEPRS